MAARQIAVLDIEQVKEVDCCVDLVGLMPFTGQGIIAVRS